jgi:EmrB/QacA subfamily drug resistance transporter
MLTTASGRPPGRKRPDPGLHSAGRRPAVQHHANDTAGGGGTHGGPSIRHGAVLIAVCVALAAVVAAMSSLNVALPDIARDTRAGQTQLAWIIDAYSLIFASLLLPAGALGDRYGRRRTLILGLVVFGAGSAVAMTTSGPTELIVLRGILGFGAALVMPATLSTITGTIPAEQRTRAVSTWAAVAGGSAIIGVLCAGLLLEVWNWRSVFGLNVVLAAIALGLALAFVPESAADDAHRLDVRGALIAAIGTVVMVYSVIEAPTAGWGSARTLLGIASGVALLASFILIELRTTAPLLDPRIFRHRTLAAGSLSILVQFFAFFGFIFIMLQYLQLVRGDSALMSAVGMLPMAVGMMPLARLSPKLVQQLGTRAVCCTGLMLVAVGLTTLSLLNSGSPYWLVAAGLLPLGAGMGAAMTPATSAITGALPAAQQGVGSALNDLSRELGGAVGIAVLGSVLTATYRNHLMLGGEPAGVVDAARDSYALAVHTGGPVLASATNAFTHGVHTALLTAAGTVTAAAAAVALLMRTRTSGDNAHREC